MKNTLFIILALYVMACQKEEKKNGIAEILEDPITDTCKLSRHFYVTWKISKGNCDYETEGWDTYSTGGQYLNCYFVQKSARKRYGLPKNTIVMITNIIEMSEGDFKMFNDRYFKPTICK